MLLCELLTIVGFRRSHALATVRVGVGVGVGGADLTAASLAANILLSKRHQRLRACI